MKSKIMKFTNTTFLGKALTNKIHEIEFQQKNNTQYPYGNNEDLTGIGQQFLEFFFTEYLLRRGYPNKVTQLKKYSDIVTLKQKLLSEKNLAEIALDLNIQNLVLVGNQVTLKQQMHYSRKNPKILAETFKAIYGAQYYDSGYDLDHMRDIIQPTLKVLLDKGQSIKVPELKQNAKSAFLEFVSNYVDLKPKISCEWKKEQIDGNVENLYSISLQLDNFFTITMQGQNKKNTEQLVYKEGLQKLRQTYQNLKKGQSNQDQPQIQDFKQSVSEDTNLTYEFEDYLNQVDQNQSFSILGIDPKKSIPQSVDQFLSQFDV